MIAEDMEIASVISLFKKGDTQNLANYRPISLLNYLYKLFAYILKQRLSSKIDNNLQKVQYGFRSKRSTAHALFVARRLQDLAEESQQNMVFVFLDWEKAFDKVDQQRLLECLRRLNIPEPIKNIAALRIQSLKLCFQGKNQKSLNKIAVFGKGAHCHRFYSFF